MTDIVKRLQAQIHRMTTDGEVEEAAIEEITRKDAAIDELVGALEDLIYTHSALVNSGDCGNWNPEDEVQVIIARAAIAKHQTTTEKEQ